MRLAIVRGSSELMGHATYNVQEIGLGKGLVDLSWSVDVFLRGKQPKVKTIYEKNEARLRFVHVDGMVLPGRQTVFRNLSRLLGQGTYDAIQVNEDSQIASLIACVWASRNGPKTILYQGMYQPYGGWKSLLQRMFNAVAIPYYKKHVDICIAKTSMAGKYLRELGMRNVKVLPVGLNWEHLSGRTYADSAFEAHRQRFDKMLIYVGKFEKRRNVDFIVRVLERLRKYVNAGLVLVGDGLEKHNLLQYAKSIGISDEIFLTGVVPNDSIGFYYSRSDLFLLPSDYEIYGMVVLEALYFGVPVIATSTAGPSDIITERRFGRIVNNLNVEEWSEACLECLASEGQNKGQLRDHVMRTYAWENIAQRYVEVIDAIGNVDSESLVCQ